MNAYRIALILCRAVAVALWWSAGLRVLSVLVGAVTYVLSASTIFGASGGNVFLALPLVVAAIFLQTFAASLAASMTGNATLEGEAIASRSVLEPPERALASAGAGLFLLFFGAATVVPFVLSQVQGLLSPRGSGGLFGFLSFLLPSILQCFVGFILAFQLGLRRLVKTQ